jgi:hypothetical protein
MPQQPHQVMPFNSTHMLAAATRLLLHMLLLLLTKAIAQSHS